MKECFVNWITWGVSSHDPACRGIRDMRNAGEPPCTHHFAELAVVLAGETVEQA